jgi:uncharacterized protein
LSEKFDLSKISSYPVVLRLVIFLLLLLSIWLPVALPMQYFLQRDANLLTILAMGILFIDFLILQKFWGLLVYRQKYIFSCYGLGRSRQNGIAFVRGLSIGFCFCLALFFLEAICGWVVIKTPNSSLIPVVLQGLLSGVGVAFAEELFFRGWLFFELKRDYQLKTVSWLIALIFAIAHFLKPIEEVIRTFVTFPALFLLGLTLAWAKIKYDDRLGICIGIHGGLVWGYYILNIGNLLTYTERVPNWITGIDGNPIAGLLGISFLSVLAVWMNPNRDVER